MSQVNRRHVVAQAASVVGKSAYGLLEISVCNLILPRPPRNSQSRSR